MQRLLILVLAILLAALSRLLPHPPNFTPIGAMALFGAAYLRPQWLGLVAVLLAMFISDLIIGLHETLWVVYMTLGIIFVLGRFILHQVRVASVLLASLSASLIFYLTTNFAVWAMGNMYTHDLRGLATCYVAAIPFFGNMLMGDLAYTALLFGAWNMVVRWKPSLA